MAEVEKRKFVGELFPERFRLKQAGETAAAVGAVVLLYALMEAAGITCPIKYVTGISCAGCGMSRAWLSVLRLDFRQAFYYHPLFWMVPAAAVVYLQRRRMNRRAFLALMYGMAAAFLAVYLYRMFLGDGEIVAFRPEENIAFKIFRAIIGEI